MSEKVMCDPWAGRAKGMVCETCISFCPKGENPLIHKDKGMFGRCRAHAPTMRGFPVVWGTDWCGDHKLDENKI